MRACGTRGRVLGLVFGFVLVFLSSCSSLPGLGAFRTKVVPLGRTHTSGILRRERTLQETNGTNTTRQLIPLHGAVKDSGYFYSSIYLGTPPKKFSVIVDTGSTMTYIPCISCGEACGPNHQERAFDPDSSHTCSVVSCRSPKCRSNTCMPYSTNVFDRLSDGLEESGDADVRTSTIDACMYSRTYVERSSSSGVVLEDELRFFVDQDGDREQEATESTESTDNRERSLVRFGCETKETGEIFSQEVDGLLGLGWSEENIVRQLGLGSFSLCFGLVEGDGALVLGQLEEQGVGNLRMVYTPLVEAVNEEGVQTPWYTVMMERLRVGGEDVMGGVEEEMGMTEETEEAMRHSRTHPHHRQVVLDSGTTFSYFPRKVFDKFAAAVSAHALARGLYPVPGPDPDFDDVCFGGAGMHDDLDALESVFPRVTMSFEGGADLDLKPLQYLFVHTFDSGKYCLGVFDNGEEEGFLLGGITVRNVLVTYDLENRRIGFGEASCRELGLRYSGDGDVHGWSNEAVYGEGDEIDVLSSDGSDVYEAYEAYGVYGDERIPAQDGGKQASDGLAEGEEEFIALGQEREQPALSYDDDWAFSLSSRSGGENLSLVLWILLGLVMAVSICGTIALAFKRVMQMLMHRAKYDRGDTADRESQPLVFSPRYAQTLVSTRKSADSRLLNSISGGILKD